MHEHRESIVVLSDCDCFSYQNLVYMNNIESIIKKTLSGKSNHTVKTN